MIYSLCSITQTFYYMILFLFISHRAAFTTEWKKPENERNAMEYHHAETNEKEVTEEQSMTSELKMREMKRKEELVEGAIDREMKRKQQSQLDGDCQMDRNPQFTKTVEKQRLKFDLQNSQQFRELKSLLEEQEHPLRTKLRMSEGGIELTMEREQDERISVEKQRLKFDLQKSQQLLAIKNLTFLTCPGDKVNKIDALQMSRLIMVKNYCGILDLIKSLIKDYKDQKDTCSVEIENLCYGILNNACTLLLEVKEIANGPNGITIGPS